MKVILGEGVEGVCKFLGAEVGGEGRELGVSGDVIYIVSWGWVFWSI